MTSPIQPMPPNVRVVIIGAGISGLTLSRALLTRGVNNTIYDRSPSPSLHPRHDYGITLSATSWHSLTDLLSISYPQFHKSVAVDPNALPSSHSLSQSHPERDQTPSVERPLRVHRGRLEALLAANLDIQWGHELSSASKSTSTPTTPRRKTLHFKTNTQDTSVTATLTIGADGVHSPLRTHLTRLSPSATPRILPYVVFRGRRLIPSVDFHALFARPLDGGHTLELKEGGALLRILLDDASPLRGKEGVLMSWTYSRRARMPSGSDPLYKPHRALSDAKIIPEEFYSEIAALASGSSSGSGSGPLEEPFAYVFSPERLRRDRIQNWLMRDFLFEGQEMRRLASEGVAFLGDAAHAMPILGSVGADVAVSDAIGLAEALGGLELGEREEGNGDRGIGEQIMRFYQGRGDGLGGDSSWKSYVEDAEKRLAGTHDMEGTPRSIL